MMKSALQERGFAFRDCFIREFRDDVRWMVINFEPEPDTSECGVDFYIGDFRAGMTAEEFGAKYVEPAVAGYLHWKSRLGVRDVPAQGS